MKRLVPLAVLLLVTLAIPATAATANGWKLPLVASVHGDRAFTSIAWHCGPDPFGTYRFHNGVMPANGRAGYVVFEVAIAADGSAHRAKLRRFGGDLPAKLERETRYVVRNALYRYTPSPSPLVESVWPDGSLQATRRFDPVPVQRAAC